MLLSQASFSASSKDNSYKDKCFRTETKSAVNVFGVTVILVKLLAFDLGALLSTSYSQLRFEVSATLSEFRIESENLL